MGVLTASDEPGGPLHTISREFDGPTIDSQALEVRIGGRHRDPFAPPPQCEHRTITQQVLLASFVDGDDPRTSRVVRRAVKLKARCGECGVPFRFVFDTTTASEQDGALGLVVDVEPAEE